MPLDKNGVRPVSYLCGGMVLTVHVVACVCEQNQKVHGNVEP